MASRFRGHYERIEKQKDADKKTGARKAMEAKYGTRHARAPRTKTEEANLSPNERARMIANNDLRTYIENAKDHDPFKEHARQYEAPIGRTVAGYKSEAFDRVENDSRNADAVEKLNINLGFLDVEHDELSKNSGGSQVTAQKAVSDLLDGDAHKIRSRMTRATRPQSTNYTATRSGTIAINMSKSTNIIGDVSDIKSTKQTILATNPSQNQKIKLSQHFGGQKRTSLPKS